MGKPLFGAQLGAYWEDRYNVEFSKRDLNFDLEQKHGDRCIDFMIDNEDGVHQIIVEVTAESHISDRKFDQVVSLIDKAAEIAEGVLVLIVNEIVMREDGQVPALVDYANSVSVDLHVLAIEDADINAAIIEELLQEIEDRQILEAEDSLTDNEEEESGFDFDRLDELTADNSRPEVDDRAAADRGAEDLRMDGEDLSPDDDERELDFDRDLEDAGETAEDLEGWDEWDESCEETASDADSAQDAGFADVVNDFSEAGFGFEHHGFSERSH